MHVRCFCHYQNNSWWWLELISPPAVGWSWANSELCTRTQPHVRVRGFLGGIFLFFMSEGVGRWWKQRHRWLCREGPVMGLFARCNQWLITFEAGSSWHGESESQRKHMTLLGGLTLIEFTQLLLPSCSRDLTNENWHLRGECGWFLASSTNVDICKYKSVAEQVWAAAVFCNDHFLFLFLFFLLLSNHSLTPELIIYSLLYGGSPSARGTKS